MNTKLLITAGWVLWGLLALGTALVTLRLLTERTTSPEAGRGMGVLVAGLLGLLLLGAGAVHLWASRRGSTGALVASIVLLAWPCVVLVAGPLVRVFKESSQRAEAARAGDFRDPVLNRLAGAIVSGDAAALRAQLAGAPPPTGRDRAGHTLLEFAVVSMCEGRAGLDVVAALLEAGADPRGACDAEGRSLILLLILSQYRAPDARAAIEVLLRHGADPNQADRLTGDLPLFSAGPYPEIVRLLVAHGADPERVNEYGITPVVAFTGSRYWESAQFLVERGVRLDVVSPSGISLDYYLRDWRESVFGEHPPGWDHLRAAIATRRASSL